MPLKKIISSGQAGVERAALDSAISGLVYRWGGWVPKGKIAEDGELPEKYFPSDNPHSGMVESDSSRPGQCMMRNINDGDATLILRFTGGGRVLSPGAKLAIKRLRKEKKSYKIVDPSRSSNVPRVVQWICEAEINDRREDLGIETLNILGPRESSEPGIYSRSKIFINDVLGYVFTYKRWGIKIWAPRSSKSKV